MNQNKSSQVKRVSFLSYSCALKQTIMSVGKKKKKSVEISDLPDADKIDWYLYAHLQMPIVMVLQLVFSPFLKGKKSLLI